MTNFRFLVAALIALSCSIGTPSWLRAGEERFSVQELVLRALEANPDLEALAASIESANHRRGAAGGFPDPLLSYSHFIESVETRLGPQRHVLQLVQPLPFPGKLSLREEIAGYDARIAEEGLASSRIRVAKEVRISAHSILALDRILLLLEQEDRLLQRYEDLIATRVETGKARQQDLLKAQIERARLRERSLLHERKRRSLVVGLNTLLNRKPDAPLAIRQPSALSSVEESPGRLAEIAANRPDLRAARHRVDQRSRSLSLVRRGYFPDFTIGMSYIDIGDAPFDVPDSGRDAWNVMVGVRLPIWFGKTRAESRAERSAIRHLERSLEAEERRAAAEIDDYYNQYRVALDLVTLYRDDLVPRAEQSLEASETGYIAGEIDILSLLDSERMLLELRILLSEKISEVEELVAELEAAAGLVPSARDESTE